MPAGVQYWVDAGEWAVLGDSAVKPGMSSRVYLYSWHPSDLRRTNWVCLSTSYCPMRSGDRRELNMSNRPCYLYARVQYWIYALGWAVCDDRTGKRDRSDRVYPAFGLPFDMCRNGRAGMSCR